MTIHLYTVCKNEVELIPHFLKYFEQFVSKIVVFDNQSTDGSRELLLQHPLVTVIGYNTKGVLRDDIHMLIKNSVWQESKGKADWVIATDLDEFLYHKDLLSYLEDSKKQGYTILKTTGFNMIADRYPTADTCITKQVKFGAYSERFSKNVLFDPNKIEQMNYSPGGHFTEPMGAVNYRVSEGLYLLHYKYLGGIERLQQRWNEVGVALSAINEQYSWGIRRKQPEILASRYDYVKSNAINIIDTNSEEIVYSGETYV